MTAVAALGMAFVVAQETVLFHWVDQKAEPAWVARTAAALKGIPYTKIRDIGVVDDAGLVILSERFKTPSGLGFDRFKAYSVDFRSLTARNIWAGGYAFHLLDEGFFEAAPLSDIVFTFQDCVECKSSTLLTAFHYDWAKKQWKTRTWRSGEQELPGAMIDSADVSEGWSGGFVYSVQDFDGDQWDEIAVWRREVNIKTSEKIDHIWLYTVKEGTEKVINIHDPLRQRKIEEQLCTVFAAVHGETDPSVCAEMRSRR